MKKILLMLSIVALATTLKGQDTIRTDFDFSTEILTDTVFRSNGTKIVYEVSMLPPQFPEKQVAFNYIIKTYNITNPDTSIFISKNKEQVALTISEMNAVKYEKRLWEWLEMYYKTGTNPYTPEQIIKVLGELVYRYKVEGGN